MGKFNHFIGDCAVWTDMTDSMQWMCNYSIIGRIYADRAPPALRHLFFTSFTNTRKRLYCAPISLTGIHKKTLAELNVLKKKKKTIRKHTTFTKEVIRYQVYLTEFIDAHNIHKISHTVSSIPDRVYRCKQHSQKKSYGIKYT